MRVLPGWSGKPGRPVSLAELGLPDDFPVLHSVFPVIPVVMWLLLLLLLRLMLLLLLALAVMIWRRWHHSHRGSGRTLLLFKLVLVEDVLVLVAVAGVRPNDGKAKVVRGSPAEFESWLRNFRFIDSALFRTNSGQCKSSSIVDQTHPLLKRAVLQKSLL